jgi:O-acetyl-ADP-ribose deacetylase (regulator of RNase III)
MEADKSELAVKPAQHEHGSTSEPDSTPERGSTSERGLSPECGSSSESDSTPKRGSTSERGLSPECGSSSEPDSTSVRGSSLEHSSTSEHGAARTLAADGIAPSAATNSGGHPESSGDGWSSWRERHLFQPEAAREKAHNRALLLEMLDRRRKATKAQRAADPFNGHDSASHVECDECNILHELDSLQRPGRCGQCTMCAWGQWLGPACALRNLNLARKLDRCGQKAAVQRQQSQVNELRPHTVTPPDTVLQATATSATVVQEMLIQEAAASQQLSRAEECDSDVESNASSINDEDRLEQSERALAPSLDPEPDVAAHGKPPQCYRPSGWASSVSTSLVIEETGNLLRSSAQFIAQQCNCRTMAAGGLAAAVFAAFPHADIYTDGTARSPGSIHIRGGGIGSGDISARGVINMLAQDLPGRPPTHKGESSQQRHLWFQQCLHAMEAVGSKLHSVAFPYGIGCGLAGGDWHIYFAMIGNFARKMNPHGVQVSIVRLASEVSGANDQMLASQSAPSVTLKGIASAITTAKALLQLRLNAAAGALIRAKELRVASGSARMDTDLQWVRSGGPYDVSQLIVDTVPGAPVAKTRNTTSEVVSSQATVACCASQEFATDPDEDINLHDTCAWFADPTDDGYNDRLEHEEQLPRSLINGLGDLPSAEEYAAETTAPEPDEYTNRPDWQKSPPFTAGAVHGDKPAESAQIWRNNIAGCSRKVISWIEDNGYILHPSHDEPISVPYRPPHSDVERRELNKSTLKNIRMGAAKLWDKSVRGEPTFVTRTSAVPKKTEDVFRLIADLRLVNERCSPWRVRFESIKFLAAAGAKVGHYAACLDFKSGYFVLRCGPPKYFAFIAEVPATWMPFLRGEATEPPPPPEEGDGTEWIKQTLFWAALPMGYKNACAIYTRLTRQLIKRWRKQFKFTVLNYLDDCIFTHPTREGLQTVLEQVVADCELFKMPINFEKSQLADTTILQLTRASRLAGVASFNLACICAA